MKKRIISMLCVLAILFSALPLSVLADNFDFALGLRVTPSQHTMDTLRAGDTVTVQVLFPKQEIRMNSFQAKVEFDTSYFTCTSIDYKGLGGQYREEFEFNGSTIPAQAGWEQMKSTNPALANENGYFTPAYVNYFDADGQSTDGTFGSASEEKEAFSAVFTVKENVKGTPNPFKFGDIEIKNKADRTYNVDSTATVSATVVQKLTDKIVLKNTDKLTPVKMGTCVTDLANADDPFTATVSWGGTGFNEDGTFAPNTVYTATITVAPKTGYIFTADARPELEGYTFELKEDGTFVGTHEYEKTADRTLNNLGVSRVSSSPYTHGDTFSKGDIQVTAYFDMNTELLGADDYEIVYPNGGSYLKAGDNALTIKYTYYGQEKTTEYHVTAAKQALTVTGLAAKDRGYIAGETSVELDTTNVTLTGVVSGEDVSVDWASVTAAMDNANAGSGKTVKLSNVNLIGAAKDYYTLHVSDINTVTVTISGIDFEPNLRITGWTYGDTPNAPSYTNTSGGNATVEYKRADADDSTYTTTAPTEVGNYVVRLTITATENYNTIVKTADFAVTAKALDGTNAAVTEKESFNYVYDGKAKEPYNDEITVDGVTLGKDAYTVTYDDNVNAGSVTATFTGKGNYQFSFTRNFEITKCLITIRSNKDVTWESRDPENDPFTLGEDNNPKFDFDGKEHGIRAKITSTETVNGISLAELIKLSYPETNPEYPTIANKITGEDASGYTAIVEFGVKEAYARNYTVQTNGGKTYTTKAWSIVKATVTTQDVTARVRYGVTAENTVPLSQFGDFSLMSEDTGFALGTQLDLAAPHTANVINVNYRNGNIVFTVSPGSEAGQTATYILTFTSNNFNTVTAKLTINITDKENAGLTIASKPETLVYGETGALTVNIANAEEGGMLQFTTSNDEVAKVEPAEGDGHVVRATGVGTATITVTYNSENYYGTATFDVTVTAKPITVKASDVTIGYGEAIPTLEYKLADGFTLVGSDELAKLGITASVNVPAGNPKGTYNITLNADPDHANPNYSYKLINGTLTITPKAIDKSNITVEGVPAKVTYNGAQQKPEDGITVKLDGTALTKGTDYTLSYGENKNAGTGTVTVKLTGNYSGEKTVEFTISPKELKITNLAVEPRAYNGKTDATLTGTLDGVCNGDSFDIVFPAAEFENKDAGTDKVVKVTDDFDITPKGETLESNYTLTQPNKTGLKGAITAIDPGTAIRPEVTVRYNDTSLQRVEVGASGIISGDKPISGSSITLTNSADANKFEIVPIVNYGKGAVEFGLADNLPDQEASIVCKVTLNYGANYTKVVEFDFTIKLTRRQPQSELGYSGTTSMTYGQSLKLDPSKVTGGSGTGAIGFSVDAADGTIVDNVFTPSHAGSISLTITKGADSAYASASKTIIITVNPAAVPVEPTYTEITTSGKTFADVGLTFPGFTGKVEWKDANGNVMLPTDEVRVNTEYTWVFTPDNTNYAPATGKLTPYVDNSLIYLPGIIGGSSKFNFHDVNRFDYYYDAVKWAVDSDITSGTARFTFSPDAVCTRAQTVTFLWRAAGSPLPRYRTTSFTDVSPNAYYYNAVLWAVEQGITTGLTATTFGPDATVTRGQVAAFLYRAAAASRPNTFNPFTDVKASAYNYDAILWAYDNRITTGTSTTTFSPDAPCTRAQIVTFLYRFYQGR